MVFSLAVHLLGDQDEALDLSQEVFLNVFRTIGRFRGQSALRTWIYRIVINQVRNRQRWWRRRHRADQVSLDEHVEHSGEFPARPDTSYPDRLLGGRNWPRRSGRRSIACVRSADGSRAAGDRRPELRGDCVFAGRGVGT